MWPGKIVFDITVKTRCVIKPGTLTWKYDKPKILKEDFKQIPTLI